MSIPTDPRTDHLYTHALPLGVTRRPSPTHARATNPLVWPWIAAAVLVALSVLVALPLLLR
jgi:hypothetical protein